MKTLEVIRQFVLADFRERTRRYSFLLTLAGVFFWGYLVMTGKYTLLLDECRGVYNSPWVGSLMAMACTPILIIAGFYLVKNSVTRDRKTGVGEIIATTPVSRTVYVLSKAISNFCVLMVMVFILAGAALIMQLTGGAGGGLDLWALYAPILFITVPMMVVVAAAAMLFESIRLLRGGIGNVIWLLLAEFTIVSAFWANIPILDVVGINLITPSMKAAALEAYPGAKLGVQFGFVSMVEPEALASLKLFHWDGISWTAAMALPRLFWIGVAFVLTSISAVTLNRFDPAAEKLPFKKKKKKRTTVDEVTGDFSGGADISAADLRPVSISFSLPAMLLSELRLLLKGFHWFWYLIALALLVLQLVLPLHHVRTFVLPAAWIWPILIWSSMGTREARFNTGQLLYSSAHPLSRQLPATWLAGLIVTMSVVAGMAVRALIAGDVPQLTAWLVAVCFVPTLALTLGVLSGSRKLFEIIYTLIWYIGPVNKAPALDFAGITDAAIAGGMPLIYLAITLVMIPVVILARKRQLVM